MDVRGHAGPTREGRALFGRGGLGEMFRPGPGPGAVGAGGGRGSVVGQGRGGLS